MKRLNSFFVFVSACLIFITLIFAQPSLSFADVAPCAPGSPSVWAPAAKDFLGTAIDRSSVYFTGAQGILTEVFYPTVDRVQNVDTEFIVTDTAKTWGDEERRQIKHEIQQVNQRAMVWSVTTTDDDQRWKITKKIFTDPNRPTVIQRVTFEALEPGKTVEDYNLYLLSNPAINNTGSGAADQTAPQCEAQPSKAPDNSRTLINGDRVLLVASEPNSTASALAISLPWKTVDGSQMVSHGFVGQNDGYSDLLAGSSDKTMNWHYQEATQGNVAQMGWIDLGDRNANSISFDVVLGLGDSEAEAANTAIATLTDDLTTLEQTYTDQWIAYNQGLNNQNGTADDQYYLAAMTLKTIQDKSNGAMIAGLGTPWGESSNDGNQGGYHLVWARDLFKFASALIEAGDIASANRAIDYLFEVQMEANGRFPQNTFVDGTPWWNATQMDQTAVPIILAWKLNRTDLWSKVKLAAEYIAQHGPYTEQERWEEMAGYSPATIAAEIAGLVCAADLAEQAGDEGAADYYLKVADAWRNNVAGWTFTTNGPHGNHRYYLRLTHRQNPNEGDRLTYGNKGGNHDQREIIDGGFLELARMGVMSPNDWTILETLPEYDAILKQTFPGQAEAWFRYNYDGYGETNDGVSFSSEVAGRGRLWPIFTAERGIYEIARSGDGAVGQRYLKALKSFSSQAGFLSEQIWNQTAEITDWPTLTPDSYVPGTATRSIRPLSWAMGEYINLVAAIHRGTAGVPEVVCQRYACDQPQSTVTFNVNAITNFGENVYLMGNHSLLSNWKTDAGIQLHPDNYPIWNVTVSLPASTHFEYRLLKRDAQNNVISQSSPQTFVTPSSGRIAITSDGF